MTYTHVGVSKETGVVRPQKNSLQLQLPNRSAFEGVSIYR